MFIFVLNIRRLPRSKRTDTLFPNTTHFRPKTASAIRTLTTIHPPIDLIRHDEPIGATNADRLVSQYDLVADGSDNFDTRDAVHAACRRSGKTLVSAAIQLTSGILTTFKSHEPGENPCFRCLRSEEHTSELQSLMRTSHAVFCLKKKK